MPKRFVDIEPVTRSALSADIAKFVPDGLPLERLINFATTGLTGEPLVLPSHPIVPAKYLALLKKALRCRAVELRYGAGRVGVVLVGFQRPCFTYTSVTPMMGESGLAKINLDPSDWRHPDDRARYLDSLNPEIYTGDPIAFAELATLNLTTRPAALISTSMTLLDGFRSRLEEHFRCPIVDVYSMNEAGTIAAADGPGHALLQPELYVEILDRHGEPLPPGQRGEITLTGGFNPYLPLLRYRTGDFAALDRVRGQLYLIGLEGRPPVMFQDHGGRWFNNINVTHQLAPFALSQFTVTQCSDRSVVLRVREERAPRDELVLSLGNLFGPGIAVTVNTGVHFDGKVIQYTSELPQTWTQPQG